ncbi:MAG: porin family protein [Chitinophagales bacterium]
MKFQKKLTAIILLLFVSTLVQARVDQKVSIGLMANPIVSWLRIDNGNIERNKAKFGIEYGVLTDIHFTENYALSTGLSVMLQGGTMTYTNNSLDTLGDTRVKMSLHYINLPLYLKLKTNEMGYITYYGEFGIINQFRIKGSADAERADPYQFNETVNITKKDNELGIRSQFYNMSLHIGAGIEYSLGTRTKIQAGLFYNNGFVNIIKDNDEDKIFINNMGLRAAVIF